jgi:hypothetical protein
MGTISNDGGDASGHSHKLVSSFSNLKSGGTLHRSRAKLKNSIFILVFFI